MAFQQRVWRGCGDLPFLLGYDFNSLWIHQNYVVIAAFTIHLYLDFGFWILVHDWNFVPWLGLDSGFWIWNSALAWQAFGFWTRSLDFGVLDLGFCARAKMADLGVQGAIFGAALRAAEA